MWTFKRRFKVKEDVQVLDPITRIWENAIVLFFDDDWNVRIKYVNWSGNKTALIKQEDRNNREYFEKWPI